MTYFLPKQVDVGGVNYEIRSDYRATLDIIEALGDKELSDSDRAFVALNIFYPAYTEIPPENIREALEHCFWFIDCGEPMIGSKQPKLVDWAFDFPRIVAPVSRIIGRDVRGMKYLHWWSFIAAYQEIGDCLFAQIVAIRWKKSKGKQLDKQDREFYQQNRQIIDFPQVFTEEENNVLAQWIAPGK